MARVFNTGTPVHSSSCRSLRGRSRLSNNCHLGQVVCVAMVFNTGTLVHRFLCIAVMVIESYSSPEKKPLDWSSTTVVWAYRLFTNCPMTMYTLYRPSLWAVWLSSRT